MANNIQKPNSILMETEKYINIIVVLARLSSHYYILPDSDLLTIVNSVYGDNHYTLDMKKFSIIVELSRKTSLHWNEIETIADRRSKVQVKYTTKVNTFGKYITSLIKRSKQLQYSTSSFEIRKKAIYGFGKDDETITEEEFIQMVELSQTTPLTDEEIRIIISLRRRDF